MLGKNVGNITKKLPIFGEVIMFCDIDSVSLCDKVGHEMQSQMSYIYADEMF